MNVSYATPASFSNPDVESDRLDQAFSALSDPTRRAILARLSNGEATVMELAEPFELTQPSISKHLKVLERAGLISRGRAAQTRPCRLETARLREVSQWVQTYRKLWEESFDRLDMFLQIAPPAQQEHQKKGIPHARKK